MNFQEAEFNEACELYADNKDLILKNVIVGHPESCVVFGLWPTIERRKYDSAVMAIFIKNIHAALSHRPGNEWQQTIDQPIAAVLYSIRNQVDSPSIKAQIDTAIRRVMKTEKI